jgi:hypothetical protein
MLQMSMILKRLELCVATGTRSTADLMLCFGLLYFTMTTERERERERDLALLYRDSTLLL